jgi:hypothetical protein
VKVRVGTVHRGQETGLQDGIKGNVGGLWESTGQGK